MKKQQGYIGIVTVLIVTAITLTLGVTIALLGINEAIQGYEIDQGQEVAQKADGCLEEAYLRLKLDSGYTGGTIPYVDGSCTVTVAGGGSSRTITSTVTIGDYTRTIQGVASLVSNVAANSEGVDSTSWQEQ
jgi:hypothetical protein